jgi:hypothetical protein
MRKLVFLILSTLLMTVGSTAQTGPPGSRNAPALAQASKVEPQRVLSGVMRGNRITVSRSDWINDGQKLFEYRLDAARIADGRLEFTGSYQAAGGKKPATVASTLVSTTARSANPWPGATSATSRERRPTTQPGQTGQRERSEVSEQTQSLYSAADPGSGCELLFLKIQLPGHSRPTQVGVALAHFDNEMGYRINQSLCRIVRAIDAGEDAADALSELNGLLGGK